MSGKSRAEILAASAAFLERTMEEERAEIIERLCESAAPNCSGGFPDDRAFADSDARIMAGAERMDRIDLFCCDYQRGYGTNPFDHDWTPGEANVRRFPDLYGDWCYRPPRVLTNAEVGALIGATA